MTINEILEYVMHTPGNTNPAVLKDQLKRLAEGKLNKVEKISGTLDTFADDFNEYFGIAGEGDASFIESKFRRGDYHAVILIDGSVLGAGESYFAFNPLSFNTDTDANGSWFANAFGWEYESTGVLDTGALMLFNATYGDAGLYAYMYQNGDGTSPIDIMPYAEYIPYELTIYSHLMQGGSGEGGNPNRVQVITGTLANPWGDMTVDDFTELATALANNTASATITASDGDEQTHFVLSYDVGTSDYIYGYTVSALNFVFL